MKLFLYLLVPMVLFSTTEMRCSKAKPVTAATPPPPPPPPPPGPGNQPSNPGADVPPSPLPDGGETPASTETYRLVVSFYSKGAGIDVKTAAAFEQFLVDYRPVVHFETVSWGREGEKDYCLKLTELSTNVQDRFIEEARIKLANTQLVNIIENSNCVHKH